MSEFSISEFNGSPYTFDFLSKLASQYPKLSLVLYGRSVMGAPLLSATLGTGPRKVLYTAAHHGNEWLTCAVMLRFLEEFCSREDWQWVLNQSTLCFIPLVNPDGVDLVTGVLNSGPYYADAVIISQNYPQIPFTSGWKANIQGIDLNLQYPAGWEKARELKFAAGYTSPAPRDFVGDYPLQAVEANTLAGFTNIFDPDILLALHSQGQVIYYMYNGYAPEGSLPLARKMSEVSGYALAETPSYSDNAGYKDWFIDVFDRPGFTVEMGIGQNPLPISQFSEIYADCEPMFFVMATGV